MKPNFWVYGTEVECSFKKQKSDLRFCYYQWILSTLSKGKVSMFLSIHFCFLQTFCDSDLVDYLKIPHMKRPSFYTGCSKWYHLPTSGSYLVFKSQDLNGWKGWREGTDSKLSQEGWRLEKHTLTRNPPVPVFLLRVKPRLMLVFTSVTFWMLVEAVRGKGILKRD